MTAHRERPSKRINPSGRTVWVARYTGRDGKRKSNGSFPLKGPCRTERADGMCCAQHAIWKGYEKESDRPERLGKTVKDYAVEWFRLRPRSPRTNDTNAHRLQVVLGPFLPEQIRRETRDRARGKPPRKPIELEGKPLGDWLIEDLRPAQGKALLAILLIDQGRSARGAKNILLTLSALFTDAIDEGYTFFNPWQIKVKASDPRVRKEPRKVRIASWDEMHRLCRAAGEYEPMLRVITDCGLRLGEALGLEGRDVKLGRCDELACRIDAPHLHVRRTAHDGVITKGTKRERLRDKYEGGRVVPLPPALTEMLRALPRRLPETPMWLNPAGNVWREDTFRDDVWNPARRASGVDVSPHDCRHSWVSELRASGVDPADLAVIAGHSVAMADAVYTHALGRSYDIVSRIVGEAAGDR